MDSEKIQWLDEEIGIFDDRIVVKEKGKEVRYLEPGNLGLYFNLERNWQLGPGYRLLRMTRHDSGLLVKRLAMADGRTFDIPFTTVGLHKHIKRPKLKKRNANGETLFDTEQYRRPD